jgi:hypothetical protein
LVRHSTAASLDIKTYTTEDGQPLVGGNTYHMDVPTNVPVKHFWAVDVCDAGTAGFTKLGAHQCPMTRPLLQPRYKAPRIAGGCAL